MPASGTVGIFNVDGGVSAAIDSAIADGNGTGIEKVGAGTLTLTGLNTYTGGTTISQGVLAIDGSQPLGTGTVTLNGGTLRMADCGCGSAVLANDSPSAPPAAPWMPAKAYWRSAATFAAAER